MKFDTNDTSILQAAIIGFEAQSNRLAEKIAELRGQLGQPGTAVGVKRHRQERKMSAAGRKAIAEAQRKRWAVTKAKQLAEGKRLKRQAA